MNPAALKTNIKDLPKGGTLIVNSDAFSDKNLDKAGYASNPLEDGSLDDFQRARDPADDDDARGGQGHRRHEPRGRARQEHVRARADVVAVHAPDRARRSRRSREKFAKRPEIAEANIRAFQAGYAFGETTEAFAVQYEVAPAKMTPGVYRNVTGNQALALGLVAAGVKSGLPLFLGAYPITPASGILEELAGYKHFGVRTFQAEDEIAAVGAALGASFGGSLGVSTVERPGDRAQAGDDRARGHARAAARHPRHPARRPGDRHADEAGAGRPAERDVRPQLRVAGAGGRGGDAGRLLRRDDRGLPDRAQVPHARLHALRRLPGERLRAVADPGPGLDPRDRRRVRDRAEPGRRVHAVPARPGDARAAVGDPGHAGPRAPDRRAREGGRAPGTSRTTRTTTTTWSALRAQKVAGIAADIPELEVDHDEGAKLLVLGWGGTYGPITAGVRRVREAGGKVAQAHLPLPEPVPAQPRRRAARATTACSSRR